MNNLIEDIRYESFIPFHELREFYIKIHGSMYFAQLSACEKVSNMHMLRLDYIWYAATLENDFFEVLDV